jgi:hypothetical protein
MLDLAKAHPDQEGSGIRQVIAALSYSVNAKAA